MLPARVAILCFTLVGVAAKNLRSNAPTRQALKLGQLSAVPSTPNRKLTPADWEAAAGKFVRISPRREGVQETLFAKSVAAGAAPQKCGSPCVAHCIAGQPRDMIGVKGLWKSIKHRLFEQFSDSPVVFALLAMAAQQNTVGGVEGTQGYVRQAQDAVDDHALRPSFDYLGVDRALLLHEACTTGECLQNGLRLKCNAKDLGMTELFDTKTGIYSNMCEIQMSRFRDSLELVRDYEAEHQMKFDWVTRPRPDVYFTRPVPRALMLSLDSVHVSPWAACGYGGMDWFYAVPRKLAETVADFASDVSCSDYKSSPKIGKNCAKCPGCECWLAAWMFAKNVTFQKLPWQWFTPAKFCGAECPGDWDVTPDNIMGLDSRVANEPCTRDALQHVQCPFLLQSGQSAA